MSPSTSHRERQFLQELRGRGWVKALALPSAPRMVSNLLRKGWIEGRGNDLDLNYQITEKGMAAKTALVTIGR